MSVLCPTSVAWGPVRDGLSAIVHIEMHADTDCNIEWLVDRWEKEVCCYYG